MVLWDLIRGRVEMLESVVERYQTEQKGLLTGIGKVYFYTTGAEMFRVPKEGYKNFPAVTAKLPGLLPAVEQGDCQFGTAVKQNQGCDSQTRAFAILQADQ